MLLALGINVRGSRKHDVDDVLDFQLFGANLRNPQGLAFSRASCTSTAAPSCGSRRRQAGEPTVDRLCWRCSFLPPKPLSNSRADSNSWVGSCSWSVADNHCARSRLASASVSSLMRSLMASLMSSHDVFWVSFKGVNDELTSAPSRCACTSSPSRSPSSSLASRSSSAVVCLSGQPGAPHANAYSRLALVPPVAFGPPSAAAHT